MDSESVTSKEGEGTDLKGCEACHRSLGQEDPHLTCFKCRFGTSGHSCYLCERMGERSKRLWSEFVAEAEKSGLMTSKPVDANKPRYVSMDDFTNFQLEIKEMLQASLPRGSGGGLATAFSGEESRGYNAEDNERQVGRSFSPDAHLDGMGRGRGRGPPRKPLSLEDYRRRESSHDQGRQVGRPMNSSRSSPTAAGGGEDDIMDIDCQGQSHDLEDKSGVSEWNFKRKHTSHSDDISPQDSVSQVNVVTKGGGDDPSDLDSELEFFEKDDKGAELYFSTVKEMISSEKIEGAEIPEATESKFVSSRITQKKQVALLPLAEEHKTVIDAVWKSANLAKVPMYKASTAARYKIVEKDFGQYLTPAKLDKHLKHELGRSVQNFKSRDPKLPDRKEHAVEQKLWKVEKAACLGMAAATSQTWLLQSASKQVENLLQVLQKALDEEDFKKLKETVQLDKLTTTLTLAQDASFDMLDLQAREVAQVRMARRAMWLKYTSWKPDILEQISGFPIAGNGLLCGEKLPEILEEFKLISEQIEATENRPGPAGSSRGGRKRPFTSTSGYSGGHQGGHEFKRPRHEGQSFKLKSGFTGRNNYSSRGRNQSFRGRNDGYNRGSSSHSTFSPGHKSGGSK